MGENRLLSAQAARDGAQECAFPTPALIIVNVSVVLQLLHFSKSPFLLPSPCPRLQYPRPARLKQRSFNMTPTIARRTINLGLALSILLPALAVAQQTPP